MSYSRRVLDGDLSGCFCQVDPPSKLNYRTKPWSSAPIIALRFLGTGNIAVYWVYVRSTKNTAGSTVTFNLKRDLVQAAVAPDTLLSISLLESINESYKCLTVLREGRWKSNIRLWRLSPTNLSILTPH
jgi:hypothetical protein